MPITPEIFDLSNFEAALLYYSWLTRINAQNTSVFSSAAPDGLGACLRVSERATTHKRATIQARGS